MEALATLAEQRRFLMVGDSKLVSYPNLRAMIEADVTFISPASKSYVGYSCGRVPGQAQPQRPGSRSWHEPVATSSASVEDSEGGTTQARRRSQNGSR